MAPSGVVYNPRSPTVELKRDAGLLDLLVTSAQRQPTALVGRSRSQHRAKGERGVCVSLSSVKPKAHAIKLLDGVGGTWLGARQFRQELCSVHGYLLTSDVFDDGILSLIH